MKLISWNVNGIRACVKNGFIDFLKTEKPDVLCLQEIKIDDMARTKIKFSTKGGPSSGWDFKSYTEYWNSAQRPGYSGTAILVSEKLAQPKVTNGLDRLEYDTEGRVQTAEFEKFYLINTYFPNTRGDLSRLDFKLEFNEAILKYVKKLQAKKPVIITGDFNVAHEEIDLKHPKANNGSAGFHPLERQWFTKLLQAGFIDSFRALYPDKIQYSWWSYRFNARKNNAGWRIDYFCISEGLKKSLKRAEILDNIKGSDHCPVTITLSS